MTDRQSLAHALRERLQAIADRDHYARDPSGHLERLKEIGARLNELAAKLPADTDPRLMHFLERCSYDKALALLENAPK